MRDSQIFDQAVTQFFEPMARKLRLPFLRKEEGVYEISSPHFIMRIRLHTGHQRGLNVLLRPAPFREFDENTPGIEYGIGNFIWFNGESSQQTFIEINCDDDFFRQVHLLATAAERFMVPYLLGQKDDFDQLREMVELRSEENVERIKSYRLPKSFREEWL